MPGNGQSSSVMPLGCVCKCVCVRSVQVGTELGLGSVAGLCCAHWPRHPVHRMGSGLAEGVFQCSCRM